MGQSSTSVISALFSTQRAHSYQIATGAGDDTIRIWDMRSLKALYTIPAHKSNVSDVRFFRAFQLPVDRNVDAPMDGTDDAARGERYKSGLYLASAGYDGLVKIWSADDWQLQRTLPTDAGKVMSVDISSDAKYIASGSYNRSYQLFAPAEMSM